MSRYNIPSELITDPRVCEIVVGWDRPLKTFFIQVHVKHPRLEGETHLIVHEGADLDRPITMDALKQIITPFGSIPAEQEAAMKADQAASISTRDGPAQDHMKNLLRRLFDD
ncbi:hypothetical protein SKA58_19675 [Sphingomonas sp. SKA58]|jgi:hypothetical protein|uniref:hypothetical protein n=1 Tax=Sphingomonas sp. (strain SKA58) TaxID=314266 RepID=UPI0000D7B1A6|nr:hypothetical protein [Sphingomonas sp. SKA58]EAT07484.1 hypothetical protein SKA58_19675 [Sphingomonas sp. SKA58]